jgi:hypothetical protein
MYNILATFQKIELKLSQKIKFRNCNLPNLSFCHNVASHRNWCVNLCIFIDEHLYFAVVVFFQFFLTKPFFDEACERVH